jgi:hypothetical protein
LAFFHFERFGHSSDVGLSENGASGFAAIGTGQTIALGKLFLMCIVKTSVEVFGFLLVPLNKKLLVNFEIGFGILQKRSVVC